MILFKEAIYYVIIWKSAVQPFENNCRELFYVVFWKNYWLFVLYIISVDSIASISMKKLKYKLSLGNFSDSRCSYVKLFGINRGLEIVFNVEGKLAEILTMYEKNMFGKTLVSWFNSIERWFVCEHVCIRRLRVGDVLIK